jgi:hypothetical protein
VHTLPSNQLKNLNSQSNPSWGPRKTDNLDLSTSYPAIDPVGLAMIVGANNYLKPDVPLTQIPTAFVYLGCWFLMAGAVYYFLEIIQGQVDRADRPGTGCE